jgi:hypothetical protein
MSAEAWAAWAGIVVTLGIAIVGWSHARGANTRAKTAEEHAAEALELARSAEDRADRLERMATERRDVVWVHREVEDGETLSFQNIGSDTAYDVELLVDPAYDDNNNPRQRIAMTSIEPAGRIGMKLTTLAREARDRFESAGPGILLTPGFSVRARITWRSDAGAPGIQDWDEISL